MYKTSAYADKHIGFYILDLVLFALSYAIGYVCRFGFRIMEYLGGVIFSSAIILLIIYFLVALSTRAYKNVLHRNKWLELVSTFIQIGITMVIFLLYLYVTRQSETLARMMFVYMTISALILIWTGRCIYKNIVRHHYRNNEKLSHLLIVCDAAYAESIIRSVDEQRFNDFYLCGVCADGVSCDDILGCPVVSDISGIREYVITNVVDEVLLSMDDEQTRNDLVEYFLEAGIAVHISVADSVSLPNPMMENIAGRMVLTTSNNVASGFKLGLKRTADILGGLAGLIITGILYIFIAPQIRRADPGPVFFRQARVGKNGRTFYIYKFRSMYVDAEARKKELMDKNEMSGPVFKIEDDPRILPGIGHRIRDWSLDEFPQFWNVFKGDMSLVGTRPPTIDEFSKYEAHHKSRLSFRPGITGLWQVSGRSAITDFEEIVRLDNEYIRNWSLWLDTKLIFKTIGVVIGRKGSM